MVACAGPFTYSLQPLGIMRSGPAQQGALQSSVVSIRSTSPQSPFYFAMQGCLCGLLSQGPQESSDGQGSVCPEAWDVEMRQLGDHGQRLGTDRDKLNRSWG
jgi:hypothetical protein